MVKSEIEILVSVGRLSADGDLERPIFLPHHVNVEKTSALFLPLRGELDVRVQVIQVVGESLGMDYIKLCVGIICILVCCGDSSSTSSMYVSLTVMDNSEPIAVLWICM